MQSRVNTLRDYVSTTVAAAKEMSENGVLSAGESLRNIISHARAQVDDMAVLGDALNGNDSGSVSGRVSATSHDMRRFISETTEALRTQQGAIEAVEQTMTRILEIGSRIEGISAAARFLALNAVIEANRLGSAGKASRVIANEMKELAGSIDQANAMISSSASQLVASIPAVVGSINKLLGEASDFHSQFESNMSSVDSAFQTLDETARRTRALSDERLTAILAVCNAALSGLQFQDPMVQLLDKIALAVAKHAAANDDEILDDGALESLPPPSAQIEAGTMELF